LYRFAFVLYKNAHNKVKSGRNWQKPVCATNFKHWQKRATFEAAIG